MDESMYVEMYYDMSVMCTTNNTDIYNRVRRSRQGSRFNEKLSFLLCSIVSMYKKMTTSTHHVRFRLIYLSPNL